MNRSSNNFHFCFSGFTLIVPFMFPNVGALYLLWRFVGVTLCKKAVFNIHINTRAKKISLVETSPAENVGSLQLSQTFTKNFTKRLMSLKHVLKTDLQ